MADNPAPLPIPHENLDAEYALLHQFVAETAGQTFNTVDLADCCPAGGRIAAAQDAERRRLVLAVLSRLIPLEQHYAATAYADYTSIEKPLTFVLCALLETPLPFTGSDLEWLLGWVEAVAKHDITLHAFEPAGLDTPLVKAVEDYTRTASLSTSHRAPLQVYQNAIGKRDAFRYELTFIPLQTWLRGESGNPFLDRDDMVRTRSRLRELRQQDRSLHGFDFERIDHMLRDFYQKSIRPDKIPAEDKAYLQAFVAAAIHRPVSPPVNVKLVSRLQALLSPTSQGTDGPDFVEQELAQDAVLERFITENISNNWYDDRSLHSAGPSGMEIAAADAADSRRFVLAVLNRLLALEKHYQPLLLTFSPQNCSWGSPPYSEYHEARQPLDFVLKALLQREMPLSADDLEFLLAWACEVMKHNEMLYSIPLGRILKAVEFYQQQNPLSESHKAYLNLFEGAVDKHHYGQDARRNTRKLITRIQTLLGTASDLILTAGEAWSDQALLDLQNFASQETVSAWMDLLQHCEKSSAARPSGTWNRQAGTLLEKIGGDSFKQHVLRWFPLVDKPRTRPKARASTYNVPDPNLMIDDVHMDILKGLAWCCARYEDNDIAKALTALTLSAYKKVPGIGPRAVRVGNACVYALGNMPGMIGVHQLTVLKVRVKFRKAMAQIEKALSSAAERAGLSATELEEISVPAYGLEADGVVREQLGDFTAELAITSTTGTVLRWLKADGKVQKTVPKAVKDHHAEALKELKDTAKDIQKMLPAQRDRIDNLYLQQRSWDFPAWQQHYLHHPLMGWLSRRLIWQFTRGDEIRAVIPHADGFCDSRGEAIVPDKDCRVSLWHPLDSSVEEIQSWREWLESHAIVQPFKQAHREVYLLTDAERNTATYSNRFAAHILKQHQFNVLAAGRRWAYNLVGCWDGSWEENARLCLPQWNLRAEFWVDGVEDGTDTTEAGVYHYVSTDQVRFYRADAPESWREAQNSVPLTEIPPLVLSEVFRDVDLFVSVASVGNDPQWADSGPDVEGRSYWEAYSFGDLSATAKTRKAVLERLVPRLKIAQRCEITDKFLIVHGDIRSYKIHLGSGNILMTPDNQYLCIVTARGKADQGDIFLPFEGDNMLAIILSKAFMLAEDTKIKDSTILSQIK